MGWKGAVRSIGAAVRAAERESKRRDREFAREQKQLLKAQELELAAETVAAYEEYMDQIQSLHKECVEPIDWVTKANRPEPKKPEPSHTREKQAREKIENYKPGFVARMFRREELQRTDLEQQLVVAISEDVKAHEADYESWQSEHSAWKEEAEFARRLMEGETDIKVAAIKKYHSFSDIEALGSDLNFQVNSEGMVHAELKVQGSDIILDESYSLLQSGKLSVKKMPKGRFYETYQDYVCSCMLRIGRELFAILPDSLVVVTATDDVLDTRTGHQENTPILSIVFSRTTMKDMNMERIDPSDSLSNFIHNMKFKKTSGFSPVDIVDTNNAVGS